jgi:3-phenylpropionate/trans-cinnamate dioxygenase ferredoxin subunit
LWVNNISTLVVEGWFVLSKNRALRCKMTEFVEVPEGKELKSGQMKMFNVGKREILLARVGDDFYAADNHCPHMGARLSEGTLQKTIITCPRHHSQFDLTDGHVARWTEWAGAKLSLARMLKSPRSLNTYKVKVEEGKVLVGIDKVPVGIA